MGKLSEAILNSDKIVIKIGSNVLSDDNGRVNELIFKDIAEQVTKLYNMGKKLMIVSSGAGICGVGELNKWDRRKDLNYRQALCAIGQVELINAYKKYLNKMDMKAAQILLTRNDFKDSGRSLSIRNVLFTLIDEGVIPIINENDTVATEELKIGDNDTLGALTAELWNANLLIMLGQISGIYDKSPERSDAKLIKEASDLDELRKSIEIGDRSDFGSGGVETKLSAAERLKSHNIPVILLNGKHEHAIIEAMEGREDGTILF